MEGLYPARLPSVLLTADRTFTLRGGGVPLSRGLPCPELGSPCPLTDGQLDAVDAGLRASIALDLGATQRVQAVVVRGAEMVGASIALRLETDDGGTAFERTLLNERPTFGDTAPSFVRLPDAGYSYLWTAFVVLDADGGVDARRVVVTFGEGLSQIEELSVF
ncbi:MAG: hypothetical protein ACOZQL_08820 [Myxococcota bacterium]